MGKELKKHGQVITKRCKHAFLSSKCRRVNKKCKWERERERGYVGNAQKFSEEMEESQAWYSCSFTFLGNLNRSFKKALWYIFLFVIVILNWMKKKKKN